MNKNFDYIDKYFPEPITVGRLIDKLNFWIYNFMSSQFKYYLELTKPRIGLLVIITAYLGVLFRIEKY